MPLKGYPGLANTAILIAERLPKCEFFVEPFAGHCSVAREMVRSGKVDEKNVYLSDLNPNAISFCKYELPQANVYEANFEDLIHRFKNIRGAIILIDPPWYPHKDTYSLTYSSTMSVLNYYSTSIQILQDCKCRKVFVTQTRELFSKKILSKNFETEVLTNHKRKIFGRAATVRVAFIL